MVGYLEAAIVVDSTFFVLFGWFNGARYVSSGKVFFGLLDLPDIPTIDVLYATSIQ